MIAERFITPPSIEIQKNQILQNIHTGSIEGLAKTFDDIVNGLSWEKIYTYPLLQEFKNLMPPHIPHDINQKAADALLSPNPHLRDSGQKAFLLFNAKTILSVVDSYFVEGADTKEDREDMTQSAILAVMEKFSKGRSNSNTSISIQIHRLAKVGVVEFLVAKDNRSLKGLKADFLNKPERRRIIAKKLKEELEESKRGLDEREIAELACELSEATDIPVEDTKQHLVFIATRLERVALVRKEDDNSERLARKSLKQDMKEVLSTLLPRDKKVIKECVMEGKPHREIASAFGVTEQRISQIKKKALRRLRHPSRARMLLSYVDTDLVIKLEEARRKTGEFYIRTFYPQMSFRTEEQLINAGITSIGDLFGLSLDEIRDKWQGKNKEDLIVILSNALRYCKDKDNWHTIVEVIMKQHREEFLWSLDTIERSVLEKEFGLLDPNNYPFAFKDGDHFVFAKAERAVVKKVKQKLNDLLTAFTQFTP